jgi:hypothetical protein
MLYTAKSMLRPEQDSLKPVVDRHLWEITMGSAPLKHKM